MKRTRRVLAKSTCVAIAALVPVIALASSASATHITQNAVYQINPLPTQTGCIFAIEWGEYIATAYASEKLTQSGCYASHVSVVYSTGSNIYTGPTGIRYRPTYGWVESQKPYESVFGAHWYIEYTTRSIGLQANLYTTNIFQ